MEEQQTSGQKHRRRRRRGGGNGAAGEGAEVISPEEAARLERERSEQLESIMEELGSKKKTSQLSHFINIKKKKDKNYISPLWR